MQVQDSSDVESQATTWELGGSPRQHDDVDDALPPNDEAPAAGSSTGVPVAAGWLPPNLGTFSELPRRVKEYILHSITYTPLDILEQQTLDVLDAGLYIAGDVLPTSKIPLRSILQLIDNIKANHDCIGVPLARKPVHEWEEVAQRKLENSFR